MNDESRYLSVRAAATYLGRTPRAIYHLVERGQIPCIRRGRRVFFDRVELDRWMVSGATSATELG